MKVQKVGIVGCGVMGSGIAQACAQAGYQVLVSEVNDNLLQQGLDLIRSSLHRSVEKGRLSPEDKDACLTRIKGTTDSKDFSDRDLVIEAAVENLEIKKAIFADLDNICPGHTILASNTSALSVLDIAVATVRPDKVLGLHFFNPVAVMKLLELVRTVATSDEVVEAGREFGSSLGKTVVVAQDTRGFIVNRLSTPLMLNAIRMLEANMATKEDIDNAMVLGMNHPMGPLALADLIGLDTILSASSAMYEELKDPQFAPPPLMRKMVTAGWLGRKTGKGFYEYKK